MYETFRFHTLLRIEFFTLSVTFVADFSAPLLYKTSLFLAYKEV